MTHEEHYELAQIVTGDPWLVRKRLLEYLKTVEVVTPTPPQENSTEGIVEPHSPMPTEVYLNGKPKVDYPEYSGPPTI